MKYRDLVSSSFWIGIGITFCLGALKYRLFVSGIPGPGLFPFIMGIGMIIFSSIILISSLSQKKGETVIQKEDFFLQRDSWKKLLFALFALFAYWISLEYLGFLLTTFLFMIFLLRFIEPQRLITVFTTAFLTATLSYALFKLWLNLLLPDGILGM